MDKKLMERFLAVVEHGSMTAAAKVLFLKQASVSTSIRELETQLDAELFYRSGPTLELTEAGRALVDPAIQIMYSFDAARTAVQAVTEAGPAGKLYIGCTAALASEPTIDLIARFCATYPEVELRCEEVSAGLEAFDLLKGGRMELLFHNETPRRGLRRTHFVTEKMYAVLPPGSSIDQAEVSIEDLAPFGMIAAQNMAHSNLRHASGEVASQAIPLRLPAVCEDRRMVAGLVLRGVGATVLPGAAAEQLEKQGAVLRPMAWPDRTGWIYHREGQLSLAAKRFLELVDEP